MPIPKKLTSHEIARMAGVSRSTVSKVINNYSDIPLKTQLKVRKVIDEHQYSPNVAAQLMKGKSQPVFAFIIFSTPADSESDAFHQLGSPHVVNILKNFIIEAKSVGYRLLIELIHYDDAVEQNIRMISELFLSKAIHSAIFIGLPANDGFVDTLIAKNYSIAVLDRTVKQTGKSLNIYTNNINGGLLATNHLIDRGYTSIAYLSGELTKLAAVHRMEGYQRAIKEAALSEDILMGSFSSMSGENLAASILKRSIRPDAIVCGSDSMAYGVIKHLSVNAPAYLATVGLIGFDDSHFNELQNPSLSSIKTDYREMARATIHALLNDSPKTQHLIPVELVKRESSRQKVG